MPDIFLTKMQGGMLCAASPQDYALMKSWSVGDVLKAKVGKPRNGGHHRKAFALINFIFENQDRYATVEDLLVEIKLKAGHYREHITTKGKLVYIPKSIAFAAMDQAEFNIFYEKMIDIALQHFCQNMSEHQLRRYVDGVLAYSG